MKKEPSNKLACLQRHGLLKVLIGIISPEERDIYEVTGAVNIRIIERLLRTWGSREERAHFIFLFITLTTLGWKMRRLVSKLIIV
jgi:hypothetical protein